TTAARARLRHRTNQARSPALRSGNRVPARLRNSGRLRAVRFEPSLEEGIMQRALTAVLAVFSALFLLSCATGPSRERTLVSRAVEASGGAQALAGVRTVWGK